MSYSRHNEPKTFNDDEFQDLRTRIEKSLDDTKEDSLAEITDDITAITFKMNISLFETYIKELDRFLEALDRTPIFDPDRKLPEGRHPLWSVEQFTHIESLRRQIISRMTPIIVKLNEFEIQNSSQAVISKIRTHLIVRHPEFRQKQFQTPSEACAALTFAIEKWKNDHPETPAASKHKIK